jgi:hypothetical protein
VWSRDLDEELDDGQQLCTLFISHWLLDVANEFNLQSRLITHTAL